VDDLIETDPTCRHPFRIELYLELAEVPAEPLDCGDAWDCEKAIADVELGEISERHEIRRTWFRLESEFENLVQPTGNTGQERRRCTGWQLPTDLSDALRNELP